MSPHLSAEQRVLHDDLAEFGRGLGGDLVERDRTQEFRRADWVACARQGVLGLGVPSRYGGAGHPAVTCAGAMEGLGLGCRDNGLLIALGAHMWAVQFPILTFGTESQRQGLLPPLIDGRMIGAHAITEAGSGSDAMSMAATARRDGDGYVLNGTKRFITNAPVADVFVVYANLNPRLGFTGVTAFLVERNRPGLTVRNGQERAGLRTAPWGELVLDECRVPADNRLGAEKQGSAVFAATMAWERALILAPMLGMMRRQHETAVAHVRSRRQFGQIIGRFQAVADSVVDAWIRLETARLLTYQAAADLDEGISSALPELVNLEISEAAVQSSLTTMKLLGGLGYTKEAQVERNLRDALGTRISSGTSEMLSVVIAAKLGLHQPLPAGEAPPTIEESAHAHAH